AKSTATDSGSIAGQPGGMPGVGPTKRPTHVSVVGNDCIVQLAAPTNAVEAPPATTTGGMKRIATMETWPGHAAEGVLVAAPAAACELASPTPQNRIASHPRRIAGDSNNRTASLSIDHR